MRIRPRLHPTGACDRSHSGIAGRIRSLASVALVMLTGSPSVQGLLGCSLEVAGAHRIQAAVEQMAAYLSKQPVYRSQA